MVIESFKMHNLKLKRFSNDNIFFPLSSSNGLSVLFLCVFVASSLFPTPLLSSPMLLSPFSSSPHHIVHFILVADAFFPIASFSIQNAARPSFCVYKASPCVVATCCYFVDLINYYASRMKKNPTNRPIYMFDGTVCVWSVECSQSHTIGLIVCFAPVK